MRPFPNVTSGLWTDSELTASTTSAVSSANCRQPWSNIHSLQILYVAVFTYCEDFHTLPHATSYPSLTNQITYHLGMSTNKIFKLELLGILICLSSAWDLQSQSSSHVCYFHQVWKQAKADASETGRFAQHASQTHSTRRRHRRVNTHTFHIGKAFSWDKPYYICHSCEHPS